MVMWCPESVSPIGYHSLAPVADEEIFVCGCHHLPSQAWYEEYKERCENCGLIFSSPEAELCFNCSPETRTWRQVADQWLAAWSRILGIPAI